MFKAVDDLASMLTQRIKDKLDDWRKHQEQCAHEKVQRKTAEAKKRRQRHLLKRLKREKSFSGQQRIRAQMRLEEESADWIARRQAILTAQVERIRKAKERRALLKLQSDVRNVKTQQEATPLLQRLRTRQKPPYTYYWPRKSPSSHHTQQAETSPAGQNVEACIPTIIITDINVSPAPEELEAMSRVRDRHSTLNPALLMPPPRRSMKPSGKAKTDNSPSQKHQKAKEFEFIAPKPSLFSFNICKDPNCPIEWTHEQGIFRFGGECATKEEQKTARATFGKCIPPPDVWEAYRGVAKDYKETAGDVILVNRRNLEILMGFTSAHRSS